MSKSERLQVIVPEEVASAWKEAARLSGTSLSGWIAMRAQRPDCRALLEQLEQKITELARSGGPSANLTDEEEWMVKEMMYRHGLSTFDQGLRLMVRVANGTMSVNQEHIEDVRGDRG